jgi:hypothetical protein
MREPIYYGDYLQLDRLLSSQEPESAKIGTNAHDEMLFRRTLSIEPVNPSVRGATIRWFSSPSLPAPMT